MSFKKMFKKTIVIVLVLILSVNSFAAVISDNDGSALITKAEFDSLKNNFQAQIDQYNTSIDNKIDGAIAAYLAGIRVSRETTVQNLVSNYDEILWRRKFDVYGGYTVYLNNESSWYTQDSWFIPEFRQFMNYRDTLVDGCFNWNRWQYGYTIGIRFNTNFNSVRNASCLRCDPYNGATATPVPIYLRCNYDSVDEIQLGSAYHDEIVGATWAWDTYHGANPIVGTSAQQWNGSGWTEMGNNARPLAPITETGESTMGWPVFESRELTGDEVIGFYIYCNRDNTRSGWARLGSTWTISEFNPAYSALVDVESAYKKSRTIPSTAIYDYAPDSFSRFADGRIRNPYIEPGYGQSEKLKYTMFGDDVNDIVNILRQSNVKVGRTSQMRTDFSDWITIECTVREIILASSARWTLDDGTSRGSLDSKNYKFNLKYPYLERYPLKNITSTLFKNGESNLKFGEGLPISTYLNANGKLTIEFDYEIGRTAQTVSSTEDKRIKIDIKKSNFLSSTDDYYTGTVDDGTAAVKLKDVTSGSSTSQKSKIVIENVKEGEAVWMRIKPYSTTAGLYAKMSNLTSKIESE